MCGRFSLQATAEEVELFFDLTGIDPRLFVPRYNIAPTQPVVVIRKGEVKREAVPMRWGLWPAWVKDPNDFPLLINARADTIATKNSFRNAFKRRRCLIPASGFYEWKAAGGGRKQPYWIAPPDAGLVAFAGLWETWCGADGSEVDTAAIITTGASAALEHIHHRMPVVIEKGDFDAWLADDAEPQALLDLLAPSHDERFAAVPVSTRVNAARNDDPELIRPVALAVEEKGGDKDTGKEAGDDQPSLF